MSANVTGPPRYQGGRGRMTRAALLVPPAGGTPPEVGFALLHGIIAARPQLGRRVREVAPATVIAAVHLWALLAVRQAAPDPAAAESLAGLETATYLDVPPPAEPESPRTLVRPRRLAVSDAVTIPAAQGEVRHPDKAAGFQELLAPKAVAGVPPAGDSAQAAPVDERDYTGRGIVGGVAGGRPPPAIPAALAAAMALEGRVSDVLAAARGQRTVRPFELGEVEIHPQLTNRRQVEWMLLSTYPEPLREAGMEGSAVLQFVVDSTGRVDPGSTKVLEASHPLFGQAGLEVVRHAEFTPAKTVVGGRMTTVPVLVRIPLRWAQRG